MIPVSVKHAVKHPLKAYAMWSWNHRRMPGQTPREVVLFQELLTRAAAGRPLRVFEYGAGHSTVYYPAFLQSIGRTFEWRAVDNAVVWGQRVRRRLVAEGLAERVEVSCHAFPAWWELQGYSLKRPACFGAYADPAPLEAYINQPAQDCPPFDVIIVDGRFRRRCLLVARRFVAEDGIVVLHDAQRPHYHEPLTHYAHQAMIPTEHLHGSRQRLQVWLGSPANAELITTLVRFWTGSLAEAS